MRELKFRGKDVDNRWRFGYLLKDKKLFYISVPRTNFGVVNYVIDDYTTIGQYTGLKDKNDIEIYEGDIVKCKLVNQINRNGKWINEDVYENYEVIFSKEDLGFRFKDQWMSIWKFEKCELEVIGNIYENKKLLEEEGNQK